MIKKDKLLLGLSIIASTVVGSPVFSQNQDNIKDQTNKNLITNINGNEKVHETIIKMDIDSILKIYGQEKGIEIINEHILIEVNSIRKNYNLLSFELDNSVINKAQNQAEYLNIQKKVEHNKREMVLGKELQTEGLELNTWSFNLAKGQKTIEDVVNDWLNSKAGHRETLLSKDLKIIGLGYVNGMGGIWVLMLVG